jgi:hypothetical protein
MVKEFFNKPRAVYLSEARPDPFERLEAKQKKDKRSKPTARRFGQTPREIISKAIDGEALQGQNPFIKVRFLKESPQLKPLPHPQLEGILEASPHPPKASGPGQGATPRPYRFRAPNQDKFPWPLWRPFFRLI